MKIRLDEREAATILSDWAKKKYKTHNVNLSYGIELTGDKLKSIHVDLEVILSEDQLTDAPSQLTDEAIQRIRSRVNDAATRGAGSFESDNIPDLSPTDGPSAMPL